MADNEEEQKRDQHVNKTECPNCGESEELVAGDEYQSGMFGADDTVCLGCDRVFGPDGDWRGGVNSEVAEELHSTFLDALSGAVALDPTEEMDEGTSRFTMELFAYAHGDTMLRADRLKNVVEYWLLHYYHSQEEMDVFEVEYTASEGSAFVTTRESKIEIDNPTEMVVKYASEVLYGTDSALDEDIEQARVNYGLSAEPGDA
jgi:hypothetical protein